jgi:hypothetical protein
MSLAGTNFLKCAFAPPDFNNDPGQGIPDTFEGIVLPRKDVLTQSINFTANSDTYIVIAPTPGVAYWTTNVPVGTSLAGATLTAVPMPGFTTLFGTTSQSRATQVTAFRYASMVAGLYPTSNLMQFAGSINVWKIPLKQELASYFVAVPTTPVTTLAQEAWTINGLESLDSVGNDNYSGSFIEGCFSQSVNNEPTFAFNSIMEGLSTVPSSAVSLATVGQFLTLNATGAGYMGMGSMDTIVIKVSSPTGAVNAAMLKTWACIEYRVNSSSALYQSAHISPAHDPMALEMYRKIAHEVPVAVACRDNATFWERVKKLLNAGLTGAMSIPGPVGMAATGIRGITDALTALWV